MSRASALSQGGDALSPSVSSCETGARGGRQSNQCARHQGQGAQNQCAQAGVAYPESGAFISGMVADFRDVNHDGWEDIRHTGCATYRPTASSPSRKSELLLLPVGAQ